MSLEFTPKFDEALAKMENGRAFVFVTGRAGTGKSTLLRHFIQTTKRQAVVLASTGVAALNVEGETIHRFFKIPPGVTPDIARQEALERKNAKVYRKLDTLVIDEISMVRADLLDSVDAFLRTVRRDDRPFGNVRVVGIGDLHQLPPVVRTEEMSAFKEFYATPYFFSSRVYAELEVDDQIDFVELEKIYRQTDADFIHLLNSIRNRTAKAEDFRKLNSRILPGEPPRDAIVLTPTNLAADTLNQIRMDELETPLQAFQGALEGKFAERDLPTGELLGLKVGARVMCIANDLNGRFVNGSLGWIKFLGTETEPYAIVQLDGKDEPVRIAPYTWTVVRTKYVKKTDTLEREQIGSFKQLPLRLAWAVTIHKSQGKSFDKVALDLGNGAFAAGQVYVALSRCTSFEGLHLVKPVTIQQIKLDGAVIRYLDSWREDFKPQAPVETPVYVKDWE